MSAILGIDIAKKKFDAALLRGGKFKTKVFDNSLTGFTALTAWLKNLNVDRFRHFWEVSVLLGLYCQIM